MVLIDSMWDKSFDWPLVSTTMAVLMALQMLVMGALGGYRSQGAERSFAGQMLAWFGTSLVVLVIYSLLPEAWRFSRLAVISMVLGHGLAHGVLAWRRWRRSGNPFKTRRLVVAGQDMEDVVQLLRRNQVERFKHQSFALWAGSALPPNVPNIHGATWIGTAQDVLEASVIHQVDEVIFSGRDVKASDILDWLPALGQRNVQCRIAWTDAGDVMSSGGASREAFVGFHRGLHKPEVARSKKAFDRLAAMAILCASPWLWLTRRKGWSASAFAVLVGQKTWVSAGSFGWMQPAVLELADGLNDRAAARLAFTHAQDYHWRKDFAVVVDALISRRAIISHGHH